MGGREEGEGLDVGDDGAASLSSSAPAAAADNTTPMTSIRAKKIVVCTGPWIQDTMKFSCFASQPRDASTPLGLTMIKSDRFFDDKNTQVQRQVVNWHKINPTAETPAPYDAPNFPIFLIHHRLKEPEPTASDNQPNTDASQQQQDKEPILSSSSNTVAHRDADGNLRVDHSNTNHPITKPIHRHHHPHPNPLPPPVLPLRLLRLTGSVPF
jgi:hypothetical protein